jgi:hypothetical protein
MSLKKALRKYVSEKIAENHQSMDAGLDTDKYNRKVGENAAYSTIVEWLSERKDDADSDELEDLEK